MIDLSGLLTQLNRTYQRPALVAGVTDHERLWAIGATGVRRLDEDAQVTATEPFHIGSVTKPMTATVIAALVDEGQLSWTTTPAEMFPDAAAAMHPQLRESSIMSFVTHRSGLAGYTEFEDWIPFADWLGSPTALRERFTRHVLAAQPVVAPGEPHYSNAAFTVAAAMAERATSQPWEDLLRSRLFKPLHMTSAGIGWPAHGSKNAPVGHWQDGATFRIDNSDVIPVPWPLRTPAGNLHMNVADLATFARVHLQALAGHDSVASATNVQAWYREKGYEGGGSQPICFAGSGGTFYAVLNLRPSERQATVLMTNGGDNADDLAGSVLNTLTQRVAEL
ncbi:MAG TPA: serine hydrolase domain-containing protein [Candidatus Limnocylindrales bacterium]|nr:serine hydrolase domain-containing protein [Candidatus Limnocylindrales bacterium]